jgi:hypothetical protein
MTSQGRQEAANRKEAEFIVKKQKEDDASFPPHTEEIGI